MIFLRKGVTESHGACFAGAFVGLFYTDATLVVPWDCPRRSKEKPVRQNQGSGFGGRQGRKEEKGKKGKDGKTDFPFTQFKTEITRSIEKKT